HFRSEAGGPSNVSSLLRPSNRGRLFGWSGGAEASGGKGGPGAMIRGMKFVSIPVTDQDRALAFYTEKLGFRVVTDQPYDATQRWIELGVPGADTGVVLFNMGDAMKP